MATGSVVVVSGAVDYVTDGKKAVRIANGHPLMTQVTGMGCTATALIGAFLAVTEQPLVAAAQAMLVMGVAPNLWLKAIEHMEGPLTIQQVRTTSTPQPPPMISANTSAEAK